ncbi:MalY/PatB family protein [Actinocatenispora rupis]|uniref:cysteine-S-conjugate beta-lyase n=1 Tax=Actinocatenispora rupis TaxID=519421 RepID=A0A8J3J053_9ACTN|nr:aminotransferase class I/II-fold pyridoxal phosphate-dependent enzyme [Actinocatenispora rupis]GID09512.1 aminotransferase [Actinocatenispora rupis]
MHPYDRLRVEDLVRQDSIKWTMHGPDVLAAWIAEMDFPTAAPIAAALHAAVDRGYTGYPPLDAATGLPAATADRLAASGLVVPADRIRLLPDILKGMELAIRLYSAPGSPVVVPTPAYPPFFEVTRLAGREIVEVPMHRTDTGWSYDLAGLDAALGAGAGTLILCNPHNPLGQVFGAAELAAVAEVVAAHRARVVADEVHAPLVYPGATHVPYGTVSAAAAGHSVTLVSASKGWNLPGLKCAQVVLTSEADAARWDTLPFLATHGASAPGIVANLAAYTAGAEWLADTVAYLDGNRRLLGDLLAEHLPAVSYVAPAGTYLSWLDCRGLGVADPAGFFLSEARVAVNDGGTFGAAGEGWIRLNFATSREILTRVVTAMGAAVAAR